MFWLWFGKHIPRLNEKRKDMLAGYFLNLSVASFAVAVFEGRWLGGVATLLFLVLFWNITKDD